MSTARRVLGPEEHPKSAMVNEENAWLVRSSRLWISFLRSASAASMAPLYTQLNMLIYLRIKENKRGRE